jgi:hypothetical protein
MRKNDCRICAERSTIINEKDPDGRSLLIRELDGLWKLGKKQSDCVRTERP